MKLALIPARGGSKRIPRKNIADLCGKPLLYYTVNAALKSNCFDQVIVSTDDAEIAEIAISFGAQVDTRPNELGVDTATKDDLIHEFLIRRKLKNGLVTCLLPTCPFRTEFHIREAFVMAESEGFKLPVVSVKQYDFPIDFALSKTPESFFSIDSKWAYANTISQAKEVKFHPNGAIYIRSIAQFVEYKSFMGENLIGYEMSEIDSWDIDNPWQLKIAQYLMQND